MPGGSRKSADERLLGVLATGASVRGAAKITGLSESLIWRRLADSQFKARLQKARSDILERAIAHAGQACVESMIVLRRLLRKKNDQTKLKAALGILAASPRLREEGSFEERLQTLEEQFEKANLKTYQKRA
jgi:hypothetical protein